MQNRDNIDFKVRQAAAEGNLDFLVAVFGKNGDLAGADINAAGPQTGRTALHQAALNNRAEVVQFLVSVKNAKLLRDIHEQTAFDYAKKYSDLEVMRFIANKFGDQEGTSDTVPLDDLVYQIGSDRYLELTTNLKHWSLAQILKIAREEIPPGKRYMGFTFLHLVIAHSLSVDAIKAVAKLGDDHNAQVDRFQFLLSQNTPLHYLLTNENIDAALSFARFLLSERKHIDFTIRNSEGRTTLLLAARVRSARAVETLLQFGANIALLTADTHGRNILHTACILGDVDTFNIIRKTTAFRELLNTPDKQQKLPFDLLDYSIENTRAFIRSNGTNPDRDTNTPPQAPKSFVDTCLEGRAVIREMILAMRRMP